MRRETSTSTFTRPTENEMRKAHARTIFQKRVSLSASGRVSLPADVLRAVGAAKGTEFLLVVDGRRIILAPLAALGRALMDDVEGFERPAAPSFAEGWSNEEDAVWGQV